MMSTARDAAPRRDGNAHLLPPPWYCTAQATQLTHAAPCDLLQRVTPLLAI